MTRADEAPNIELWKCIRRIWLQVAKCPGVIRPTVGYDVKSKPGGVWRRSECGGKWAWLDGSFAHENALGGIDGDGTSVIRTAHPNAPGDFKKGIARPKEAATSRGGNEKKYTGQFFHTGRCERPNAQRSAAGATRAGRAAWGAPEKHAACQSAATQC